MSKERSNIVASGQPARTTPAPLAAAPRWLRLDQLPGFMWSAIRAMGASVFSPLTRTRLERIEVIAALGNNGRHTPTQIDATAHTLRSESDPANIVEYSSAEMAAIFGNPYTAQAVQYNQPDFSYLLVQDPLGRYIYRWPAGDTVSRTVRSIAHTKGLANKQLGSLPINAPAVKR